MPMLWQHGDKRKVAKAAGISPQYLTDILKGRKAATTKLAPKIVDAARKLEYSLSLLDVLYPSDSANPLIG